MQEIIQIVKTTLAKTLDLDPSNISEQSHLKDNLGLDSMTSLTFLLALEENIQGFNVDPDTLSMDDLESVKSISQYVVRQCEQEGVSANV